MLTWYSRAQAYWPGVDLDQSMHVGRSAFHLVWYVAAQTLRSWTISPILGSAILSFSPMGTWFLFVLTVLVDACICLGRGTSFVQLRFFFWVFWVFCLSHISLPKYWLHSRSNAHDHERWVRCIMTIILASSIGTIATHNLDCRHSYRFLFSCLWIVQWIQFDHRL